MKKQFEKTYQEIISVENLFAAWQEFIRGKRKKKDVQEFSLHLADNILQLHEELANFTYQHGGYQAFNISDPKPRNIHKAIIRDRILHHAIYRKLYPFFERTFIADSFSCQLGKGTHRALDRFRAFFYKVSNNNTRACWVLKCDIRKFFANVDQEILLGILGKYIPDQDIIWLLQGVIGSFSSLPLLNLPLIMGEKGERGFPPLDGEGKGGVGLPLGNLTSQLFCNIYMNEFDQFAKHKLKAKYYIRYCDDFVILSKNRNWLEGLIPQISKFLYGRLRLRLHPNKILFKTVFSGIDFLGWVHFHDHQVLRSATSRRMMKRISRNPKEESLLSYLGLLKHGNTHRLRQKMINHYLSGFPPPRE